MDTMQHLEVKSRIYQACFLEGFFFFFKEMIDINNPLTVMKSRKEITSNLVIITNQFSISYSLIVHLNKEMSDVLQQKMEQVPALAK